jgi:hypothetical protein
MCASVMRSQGARVWALKFRSFVMEVGDLLYDNFPEAKVVFLYRWVSVMERALDLQRQGVPMFVGQYEDLQAAPRIVLEALLAYCQVGAQDVAPSTGD